MSDQKRYGIDLSFVTVEKVPLMVEIPQKPILRKVEKELDA
ncbi:hypothetical protein ACR79R_20995 [Sphingobacterium spiritivorum]|nr:hypothetical protein [uncultured Dysgonomonas sp.]